MSDEAQRAAGLTSGEPKHPLWLRICQRPMLNTIAWLIMFVGSAFICVYLLVGEITCVISSVRTHATVERIELGKGMKQEARVVFEVDGQPVQARLNIPRWFHALQEGEQVSVLYVAASPEEVRPDSFWLRIVPVIVFLPFCLLCGACTLESYRQARTAPVVGVQGSGASADRKIKKTFTHQGHVIQLRDGISDSILYDGQTVSSIMNWVSATHRFTVVEDGESVSYEIVHKFGLVRGTRWSIRRNGQVLFSEL